MSNAIIRVLTADDHPLIREGLSALVSDHDDIEIIGEAQDGEEAVALFELLRPDILLLDLQMPKMTGLEVIAHVRKSHPEARVIILTTYDTEQLASQAIANGARGYLLKSSVRRELINTIRAVHSGRTKFDSSVTAAMLEHSNDDALTKRERDVLAGMADGLSNREISNRLSISEETVKGYVKNILAKLRANGRTQAVALAFRRGILKA